MSYDSNSKSTPSPNTTPWSNLMRLHPLLPHKPPTLSELAQGIQNHGVETSAKPRLEPDGLFTHLVREPNVMLEDLLSCPSKYEEGVLELLQRLVSGASKFSSLSMDEQDLLNRATLDLNRSAPKTAEALPQKEVEPPNWELDQYQSEGDEGPPQLPDGMEPYWWL